MADVDRSRPERLTLIIEHVKTALEVADQANDHILGAKLNDALSCAVERYEAIARDDER